MAPAMGRDSQAAHRKDMQGRARQMALTGAINRPEWGTPGRRSRPTIACSRRSIQRSSMGALGMVPASTAAGPARRMELRSQPIEPRRQAFSGTILPSAPPLLLVERALRGIPASKSTRVAVSIPLVAAIQKKALAVAGRASVAATRAEAAVITFSASITNAFLYTLRVMPARRFPRKRRVFAALLATEHLVC